MKKLFCLLAILMPMLSANCYSQRIIQPREWEIRDKEVESLKNEHCQYIKTVRASPFHFQNLKGVNINFEAEYRSPINENDHSLYFGESPCFIMPIENYIKAMGFDDTGENEHTLTICLATVRSTWAFRGTDDYTIVVEVAIRASLTNRYGEKIVQEVASAYLDVYKNGWDKFRGLNEALTQALEQINWHKIASFLKESSEPKQLAKEEPIREIAKEESKEVKGYGNTALENTIIRWDVQSRPAGADVFWRVVSKTPSVKSTNNKYLQTTPYEATKSLNIRGLSYENSGDVSVILRCEKEGYRSQEREFNVRMILDQEEISAFFPLVKE